MAQVWRCFTRVTKGWCNGKKGQLHTLETHMTVRSHWRQSGKSGFKGRKELEEISPKGRLWCARTVTIVSTPQGVKSHRLSGQKMKLMLSIAKGVNIPYWVSHSSQKTDQRWSNFHCGSSRTSAFWEACKWASLRRSTPANEHPNEWASLRMNIPENEHPREGALLRMSTPANEHPCKWAPLQMSIPILVKPYTFISFILESFKARIPPTGNPRALNWFRP